MSLIFSHMKDSLIQSECCFFCPGVNTLTPTLQRRMDAGSQTPACLHIYTLKFTCCKVNYAYAISGGHTDENVFTNGMNKIETIFKQDPTEILTW